MDGNSLFGRTAIKMVSGSSDNKTVIIDDVSTDGGLFPRREMQHDNSKESSNANSRGMDVSASDYDDYLDEKLGDDSSDIHSSVLHRILDSSSLHENIKNDKAYYTKLYNKYSNNNSHLEITGLNDFETYNNILIRDDRIKNKLDRLAKRMGKNDNVITPLNETELHDMFINPQTSKEWSELESQTSKLFKKSKLRQFFRRSPAIQSPSETSQYYNLLHDVDSDLNTLLIDDHRDSDDLPIDLQTIRKRTAKFHDLDIIVSHQEKLDYNLRNIENYGDLDPKGRKRRNNLMKVLDKFNLMKIFRVQMSNKYQIQRKLSVRHLNQIALGGTLGVGLLLSSGKAFTIAGPLGCLIGFVISGSVVLATMLSFCEIVTLIPLCGGVSGIASRFVDDSFGFALGVTYWLSYAIALPSEITAASIMLSFYQNLHIPGESTAAWITLFYSATVLINLFDIRVYGEFEFYSTIIKVLFLLALLIYNIVLNTGRSGPMYKKIGTMFWNESKSDLENYITFGPFRPTFDINDTGLGALKGISGSKGIFLQIVVASVVAAYAYVGTEIVIIAGSEARDPRRSIPNSTKHIYWRICVFYLIAIFIIGFNVYSGDPRLLRFYTNARPVTPEDIILQEKVVSIIGGGSCDTNIISYAGLSNGNQSPWVIAIQDAGACSFSAAVNAFMLYFAVTAGASQLYASSRTLYFLALQNKAPSVFTICNKKGVPYMSVLFTSLFGALAYLAVADDTALIFERMVSVCATTGLLVWSCMNLSFIRFYYALKLRPDIISRDEENYPYRSPLQPYLAYYGMIMAFFLVLAAGFVVFLNGQWSPVFFISSYGSSFLFIACYIVFWLFRRTKVHKLDQIDLDSGRREIDRIIWEEEKDYSNNFKEMIQKGISFIF